MRTKTLTLVAIMVAVGLTAGAQEVAEGGPKMVVPETVFDGGKVAQGETVDAKFEFVNEGDETLTINAVRPTCGCTVAEYDKEIAPGEKGYIHAHLDTRDYSGPTSKSILVMTNNPDPSAITLIVKADVQPYVEVLPRPLVRINSLQLERAEQTLTVVALEGEGDFKVTGVEHASEHITVSHRKLSGDELLKDKPDQQFEIKVVVAETAPVGPIQDELTITTNHPKAAKIPVKVYGVVRSVIQVSPPQLQFGQVKAATAPGRHLIVVNNRAGTEVTITAAEVDDAAFAASVEEIEKGKRFKVTISVKPGAEAGARDAKLTLKTSFEDLPELVVPIRASLI